MLCAYGASAARILLRETTAESRRLWGALEPIAATGPQGHSGTQSCVVGSSTWLPQREEIILKKSAAGHGASRDTQGHKAVWLAFPHGFFRERKPFLKKSVCKLSLITYRLRLTKGVRMCEMNLAARMSKLF